MSSRRFPRMPGASHQGGVGLIEVLVAVLIVSIGFLGVAALQVMSLSTNNSAMARSMATVASYSILDALRADRTSALSGAYNTSTTTTTTNPDGSTTTSTTATPVKAGSCAAAGSTLASQQLNAWCSQLGHALGAANTTTGNISCTAAGECTITITFDDSRSGGGSAQQVITKAAI
ncbi:MAG TPA: type IV pilus modification protein PilV [Oleiagrimonas sp.]|nr:type IV pilus modification protein PilV [Oleiagrimonas sp.]